MFIFVGGYKLHLFGIKVLFFAKPVEVNNVEQDMKNLFKIYVF